MSEHATPGRRLQALLRPSRAWDDLSARRRASWERTAAAFLAGYAEEVEALRDDAERDAALARDAGDDAATAAERAGMAWAYDRAARMLREGDGQ